MTEALFPTELDGLSEAEELFEALGVPYDAKVLRSHRLQVLKASGLAFASWRRANPAAGPGERRDALASALRQAHRAFADEAGAAGRCNPFAPGLVQLARRR